MGRVYNRVIVNYVDVFGDKHYYSIKCKNSKEAQKTLEEHTRIMEKLRCDGEVQEYNVTRS